jgi:hypothetical protein
MLRSQKADGIFGLGTATDSWGYPPNLIDTSEKSGRAKNTSFSLCYSHNGGVMRFGDFNYGRHNKGATPVITQTEGYSGNYKVNFISVSVGGKMVELTASQMSSFPKPFFDSGTTLMQLPHQLRDALLKAMDSFCKEKTENCAGYSDASEDKSCYDWNPSQGTLAEWKSKFPVLEFMLGPEKPYAWSPMQYLIPNGPDFDRSINYCIGMRPLGQFILGGNFMSMHDIHFDKEKHTISWVESDCTMDMGAGEETLEETTVNHPYTSGKVAEPVLGTTQQSYTKPSAPVTIGKEETVLPQGLPVMPHSVPIMPIGEPVMPHSVPIMPIGEPPLRPHTKDNDDDAKKIPKEDYSLKQLVLELGAGMMILIVLVFIWSRYRMYKSIKRGVSYLQGDHVSQTSNANVGAGDDSGVERDNKFSIQDCMKSQPEMEDPSLPDRLGLASDAQVVNQSKSEENVSVEDAPEETPNKKGAKWSLGMS